MPFLNTVTFESAFVKLSGGKDWRRITANGANVDHPPTEFYKGSPMRVCELMQPRPTRRCFLPLYRNIHIGHIVEDEVNKRLVAFLADGIYEWCRGKLLAKFIGRQTIFKERIVEIVYG